MSYHILIKNVNSNAWKCVCHAWFLGTRCMGGRQHSECFGNVERRKEWIKSIKFGIRQCFWQRERMKLEWFDFFYKTCFSRIYTEANFSQSNAEGKVHVTILLSIDWTTSHKTDQLSYLSIPNTLQLSLRNIQCSWVRRAKRQWHKKKSEKSLMHNLTDTD